MVTRAIVILVMLAIFSGCEKSEKTYKGKPESQWIQLCDDADYDTREQAWEAVASLNTPAAYQKLKRALSDPHAGPLAKSIAADALAITDPEETLIALRSLLKDELFTDPHFSSALEKLGPKARDLLPALTEAEKTVRDKVVIQKMIESIK